MYDTQPKPERRGRPKHKSCPYCGAEREAPAPLLEDAKIAAAREEGIKQGRNEAIEQMQRYLSSFHKS